MAYIAKVAMFASLVCIVVILADALLQVLIYLRVGYHSQVVDGGNGVQVHESNF